MFNSVEVLIDANNLFVHMITDSHGFAYLALHVTMTEALPSLLDTNIYIYSRHDKVNPRS